MKRFYKGLLLAALMLFSMAGQAQGITNFNKLITSDYWIANNTNGNSVILDNAGIKSFNAAIRNESRTVVDLLEYPNVVSGDSLKTKIMDYQVLEDDLFLNGKKVSENYKNILRAQTNTGRIPSEVNPKYAVVVRRTNLRNLPTGQGLFFYAEDKEFDALQETVMDPGEAVIVLHKSLNGYFYFVQCYNYAGWISKFDLAFTDKENWLKYANPKSFLVVTGKSLPVKLEKEEILIQQGTRIPLKQENSSSYVISVPQRVQQTGDLVQENLTLAKNKVAGLVHNGYLPYTSNNIVKALFVNYGSEYGWGGLKNSVDCSSLIANAYRTVGIILPRNADDQADTVGKGYDMSGLSIGERNNVIRSLMPGAVLYMDGHILAYLGTSNNIPFTIHSLGSFYDNGTRRRIMRVVVSDLNLQRSNGKTFLEELLICKEFR